MNIKTKIYKGVLRTARNTRTEPVYVIGGARTDFKRNAKKEGRSLRLLILEAVRGVLEDTGVEPKDIQAGIVGNFAGGLYTRQLHLGAVLTELDEGLRGMPTMHVEAACASGGVAVLTAAKLVKGGIHDSILVVGAEQQKTMSPADGADVLATAGDYANERIQYGQPTFPKLFGRIADLYQKQHGLTERQLAQVAVKNHAHARLNPLAQMRDSTLTIEAACAETEANPRVAPHLKVSDCSQVTDGAAGVIVCSESFARQILGRVNSPRRTCMKLIGYGHTTDCLPLDRKDAPDFSIACQAAAQAYDMAGFGPKEMHGAEVHDCFSISEIVAYEILGFAERGKGVQLLESGATALPSVRGKFTTGTPVRALPVNTGGGLMGDGHPVGATGVRQVVSAYHQLTGTAGAFQIPGAEKFVTFNMGGSVTTNVVMVWESWKF